MHGDPEVDREIADAGVVSFIHTSNPLRRFPSYCAMVDGEVVKIASSKAPYGICQTKWSPPQRSEVNSIHILKRGTALIRGLVDGPDRDPARDSRRSIETRNGS
jgi:hypothetical protein